MYTVNITAVSIGLSAMCVVFSMLLVIVTAIVVFVKLRVHKKNMRKGDLMTSIMYNFDIAH